VTRTTPKTKTTATISQRRVRSAPPRPFMRAFSLLQSRCHSPVGSLIDIPRRGHSRLSVVKDGRLTNDLLQRTSAVAGHGHGCQGNEKKSKGDQSRAEHSASQAREVLCLPACLFQSGSSRTAGASMAKAIATAPTEARAPMIRASPSGCARSCRGAGCGAAPSSPGRWRS